MATNTQNGDFPCSLVIRIPFPTNRLARSALGTLSVDKELSPLVKRTFMLVGSSSDNASINEHDKTVLKTVYCATTNRMLRVAVNGFFESVNVVVQVMEELDLDVLHEKGIDGLEGVQGVEQGMTGSTASGA